MANISGAAQGMGEPAATLAAPPVPIGAGSGVARPAATLAAPPVPAGAGSGMAQLLGSASVTGTPILPSAGFWPVWPHRATYLPFPV